MADPGITRGFSTFDVNATAGAAVLTIPDALVHGRRILGVLYENTAPFGTSQGLTGLDIGGLGVQNGWGSNPDYRIIPPDLVGSTSQADFGRGDQPIVPGLTDQPVLITALGGLFDGDGAGTITVLWEVLAPPPEPPPPPTPTPLPPFGITRGADVFRVVSVNGAAVLTIPDALVHGRRILGVEWDCTVGFGLSRGLQGIDIGGLGVQNGWGSNPAYRIIPPDLGTLTSQADFGRGDQPIVPGLDDQPVLISALGGLFDGVGEALVTVQWETLQPLLVAMAMGLEIPQPLIMAGEVITSVRDKMPDPVYTAQGVPQPDQDGKFLRAQTLYRWLNNAVRRLTRRCNWTVEDFFALPVRQAVNTYALDARWQQTADCWVSQWPCFFVDEALTIFPSYAQSKQPYAFSWHKRAGLLEVGLWPAPDFRDPVTTLAAVMAQDATTLTVDDATGFLSFGWVQVERELIEYKQLTGNVLSALRRGASGSTILAHDATAPVQHCSLWVKGIRTPNPVSVSTDKLEVPIPFVQVLEEYLLADVREAEQDHAEARSLRQGADAECERIIRTPGWQQTPGTFQTRPYGSGVGGGVYPFGPWGVLIP